MTPTVILTICDDPDAVLMAQQLLHRGCRVAVTGPDVGALLQAVRGYGTGRAAVLVGDVGDPADVARMRASAEALLGPIDVVVAGDPGERTDRLASVHRLPTRPATRGSAPSVVRTAVA